MEPPGSLPTFPWLGKRLGARPRGEDGQGAPGTNRSGERWRRRWSGAWSRGWNASTLGAPTRTSCGGGAERTRVLAVAVSALVCLSLRGFQPPPSLTLVAASPRISPIRSRVYMGSHPELARRLDVPSQVRRQTLLCLQGSPTPPGAGF